MSHHYREIENSWGFNFSRFNSNGWNNLLLGEASQDPLITYHSIAEEQPHPQNIPSIILNEPPQPTNALFKCIQNGDSQHQQIREVSRLMDHEPETKRVNHKQYFRIMKRRIKKVMKAIHQPSNQTQQQTSKIQTQQNKNSAKGKKYIYQSRHVHAASRPRGKDGKFLATRPAQERFRQKKKRGRKPKNQTPDSTVNAKPQSPNKETAYSIK